MNIHNHKFSDDDIELGEADELLITLNHWRGYGFVISKNDVIALAKHFDLLEGK